MLVQCDCGVQATVDHWPLRCGCGRTMYCDPKNPIPVKKREPRRDRAREIYAGCTSCDHYGDHDCNGEQRVGCGLLIVQGVSRPCRLMGHILDGGECPHDPPLYVPLEKRSA